MCVVWINLPWLVFSGGYYERSKESSGFARDGKDFVQLGNFGLPRKNLFAGPDRS